MLLEVTHRVKTAVLVIFVLVEVKFQILLLTKRMVDYAHKERTVQVALLSQSNAQSEPTFQTRVLMKWTTVWTVHNHTTVLFQV